MNTELLKYELIDTDKLIPYVNNSRTHTEEQIAKVMSSIKEFGFLNPILISEDNVIVAGHCRLIAAQRLGIKKVPCICENYLSPAQRKAYVIADNRLALDAGWDEDLLRIELEALEDLGYGLEYTGFDEEELKALFSVGDDTEASDDEFDVDAELEKPVFSKPGDIWHLGKHTVICGDSTETETYRSLLGDEKANLVCTDAPYFVNLESTSGKIKNDDLSDAEAYDFLLKAFTCMKEYMQKDASIYEFYATSKARVFHDAFEDAGFKVGAGLVWKKNRLVLTRTDWKYIHEPIIFGWRKDGKHNWFGDQKQVTVFEFDRINSSKDEGCGHPSSKPIPLIGYLIGLSTQTNALVLDAFLGSASTLMACEQLGRICYGIEIEPKFVDVAVERYRQFKEGFASDIYVIRDGERIDYESVMREVFERE